MLAALGCRLCPLRPCTRCYARSVSPVCCHVHLQAPPLFVQPVRFTDLFGVGASRTANFAAVSPPWLVASFLVPQPESEEEAMNSHPILAGLVKSLIENPSEYLPESSLPESYVQSVQSTALHAYYQYSSGEWRPLSVLEKELPVPHPHSSRSFHPS